ncbi:MAG: hypothetical protein EBZ51_09125 [Synechococcaceae bacterium WB9_2_112]|nr:hypothetical protein [Synechococcaceae bacterium WB9_2_112]
MLGWMKCVLQSDFRRILIFECSADQILEGAIDNNLLGPKAINIGAAFIQDRSSPGQQDRIGSKRKEFCLVN